MLNRKSQMFVLVFSGLFALGCAGQDGDKLSPSERYERAVNEAATSSDTVREQGVILSPHAMVALVDPVTNSVVDHLETRPGSNATAEEMQRYHGEAEVMAANLSRHYDVLENLDIPVEFSRQDAEAPMCTQSQECVDGAFGDPSDPTNQQYWGRAACKAGCAAAAVLAEAGCLALCVGTAGVACPASIACTALVAAAAIVCLEGCDEIENF